MKWLLVVALLVAGCASDPPANNGDDDDADPSSDKAKADAEKKTDPTGGRDNKPASCFAACQNVAMTCNAKGSVTTSDVSLALDSYTGCVGTIGTKAFKINCLADPVPQVCVADECEDGTFTAITLAFGDTICSKN